MKIAKIVLIVAGIAAAGGSLIYQYTTGGCALCAVVGFASSGSGGSGGELVRTAAQPERPSQPEGFQQVRRQGSVDLEAEYDLSNLNIPKDEIHTLLPRDAIPALTDPKRQDSANAKWLPSDARIIVVRVNDEVLGVPLPVLDWHEIVNTTVGGEPIAATYCPLCDSATVFNRRVDLPVEGDSEPETVVLEFGVSGALYNSNVLMYDRRDKGLWSQLGMRAVSGPLAGTALDMLPVEIVSFSQFKKDHPDARVVSNETGHQRNYGQSPYESYFARDGLMVPVKGVGDALPRKTLGVGVAIDDHAWFVPEDLYRDGYTLTTPAGDVKLTAGDAGVRVASAPDGVRTAQTFYYSWSAFYPHTTIVGKKVREDGASSMVNSVGKAFASLRKHTFHPLDDKSFTIDRSLKRHGIADTDDTDWRVRLLAVRDLVRAGQHATPEILDGLRDDDFQVRYAAATALGVLGNDDAVPALIEMLRTDDSLPVRAQAAVALGQINADEALPALRKARTDDSSKDVRHQCELSIDQIEKGMGATDALRRAFIDLDPASFESVRVGHPAPNFTLSDTEGASHTLSEHRGEWTVLIWVFADWCPVCHGEFNELIEMREQFRAAGVNVFTVETHDMYRGRVMVGKEVDPEYWFAEESFQNEYTQNIWWPHLLDRAGAVGAQYGVDPMAFVVHGEYINRPSTFIIDPEGTVRMAYIGTFWGDRPSIERTLDMIRSRDFKYHNPNRLTSP